MNNREKGYLHFCAPILDGINQNFEQLVRSQKQPLVFTNGCFDMLHAGHVRLLNLAGVFGWLVVGLNSDDSIRKLKGKDRPIQPFEDRALALASIRAVQAVVRFDTVRCDRLINQLKPQIYVKGGDYTLDTLDKDERAALQSAGSEILFYPRTHSASTTEIVERLKT